MNRKLSNKKNQKGQGLVEYALILVMIAVVAIVIMGTLGGKIGTVFSSITSSLASASGGNIVGQANSVVANKAYCDAHPGSTQQIDTYQNSEGLWLTAPRVNNGVDLNPEALAAGYVMKLNASCQ